MKVRNAPGKKFTARLVDSKCRFDKEKMVCSRDTYIGMTGCGRKIGRTYRNDRFKSIFTIYAKTMAQLVGTEF